MPEKRQEKKAGLEREAFLADSPSFDRFQELTERLLGVPKREVDEKRAEREKKRRQEETS